jgi:hypothetical protein
MAAAQDRFLTFVVLGGIMSIASYFFTASKEDAKRNDGLEGGPQGSRAEFYRVTDVSLTPLFTAISGKPCPSFKPAAMSDDHQQITFAFPTQFVKQLATLDESKEKEVITKWRASGEAPYDNDKDLRKLLKALVGIAKAALESGQGMFLWNCV